MAGDKDKKKKQSSKKGSKDRAKSRAKPLDAEAFDRAATTLNDATAKLMRAAERHALGDVNHDGAPPDDRARWYEEGRRAGRDEAILHDAPRAASPRRAARRRRVFRHRRPAPPPCPQVLRRRLPTAREMPASRRRTPPYP